MQEKNFHRSAGFLLRLGSGIVFFAAHVTKA